MHVLFSPSKILAICIIPEKKVLVPLLSPSRLLLYLWASEAACHPRVKPLSPDRLAAAYKSVIIRATGPRQEGLPRQFVS